MGLAPHKEFRIEYSIVSLCLVTNSVTHNNGRCYTNIAYIITPPALKSGLSQSLSVYIYRKNEWSKNEQNMLGYDLHFMVSLPWAIRLNKINWLTMVTTDYDQM